MNKVINGKTVEKIAVRFDLVISYIDVYVSNGFIYIIMILIQIYT